jgi:hypothetical protein
MLTVKTSADKYVAYEVCERIRKVVWAMKFSSMLVFLAVTPCGIVSITTFRRDMLPLRWRQHVHPKRFYVPVSPHCVTTQKKISTKSMSFFKVQCDSESFLWKVSINRSNLHGIVNGISNFVDMVCGMVT